VDSKIKYQFSAKIWQYAAPGGWYFMSLPTELAKEIRDNLKWQEEGWGKLKENFEIGNNKWETAIWFDTKRNTYLLPIKAEIRKKENLEIGKSTETIVWI